MPNLFPYFIAWAALAVVVLILALMRRSVAQGEDDSLHLSPMEAAVVGKQISVAKRLDAIDKWGKILTIVLAIAGLALGSAWAMQAWEESAKVGLK